MITCPTCGHVVDILPASYGLTAYVCPACQTTGVVKEEETGTLVAAHSTQKIVQTKLPFDPGRATTRITVKEEVVQRQTMQALCAHGYLVEQTTVRLKMQRCPHCNKVHPPSAVTGANGYGASKGVADLLARNPKWTLPGLWAQLEMKGSETRLSPKQKELADGKHILIVRSAETAIEYMQKLDALLTLLRVV